MGGSDKAFLIVEGQTFFQRTFHLMRRCFPQVIVVSNQPEKYAGFGVEVAVDEFIGRGPLAGIHAGLGLVRVPHAFVVACDMPFLRADPIEFLVRRIGNQDAIIPCWEGDIEPLHAIYATRLRDKMAVALRGGASAIREFLPQVDVDYVAETVLQDVPGAEESFRNVNTPEDAARFAIQLDL